MRLWLLLTSIFLLQEPLSATFVVLKAVRARYPIILLHLLWLSLTILQIYLGYILGRWIQRRFSKAKWDVWMIKWTREVDDLIGKKGEKVALIAFTIFTLPVFSGFVASWLPLSIWSILLFSVVGSFLWYLQVWIGVYGAGQLSSGLHTTIISVIIIGTLVSIPFSIWRKRLKSTVGIKELPIEEQAVSGVGKGASPSRAGQASGSVETRVGRRIPPPQGRPQ
jgi:membrane protein DedA with SNARE-associated domain